MGFRQNAYLWKISPCLGYEASVCCAVSSPRIAQNPAEEEW